MNKKETDKMAVEAEEALREAVIDLYRRKALLGQYVIINRDGKPYRAPAKEALHIAESK